MYGFPEVKTSIIIIEKKKMKKLSKKEKREKEKTENQ